MAPNWDQSPWESEREDAAHENALAMRGDKSAWRKYVESPDGQAEYAMWDKIADAADVFDEEETLP